MMRKKRNKVGNTGGRLSTKNRQQTKQASTKTGQEKRRMTKNIETGCCDAQESFVSSSGFVSLHQKSDVHESYHCLLMIQRFSEKNLEELMKTTN